MTMEVPVGAPTDVTADASVRAVAALDDELRRRMYALLRDSPVPLTREQVGTAVGISRKLAAFHLDKLVEVGLLTATDGPARSIGRVGRRPKAYRPTGTDVRVIIPPRQHDELADILMEAVVTESGGENARQAAVRVAGQRGRRLGAAFRDRTRPGRLGAERALSLVEGALRQWGFEPVRPAPNRVRLRNCPFQPLAAKAPALVCGINLAFVSGFCVGLDATVIDTVLDPAAGECCVELRAVANRPTPGPAAATPG